MNIRSLSLSIALFAAAGAAPANPAPGDAGTADLRTVCSQADTALQDALGGVWALHEMPATVQVRMRVEGRRVLGVRATGGYADYRRATRLAVSRLACDGGGTPQWVAFDIAFVDGNADATARRVVKLGR